MRKLASATILAVLLAVTILVAGLLCGCGSPLIDTWADRGIQGVNNSQHNILEFKSKLQKVLRDRQDSEIDGMFLEILRVSDGEIDGVKLDAQWIKEHKNAFKLLMKLWDADQKNLDTATAEALANLDSIVETFEQIKHLRRAWGDVDQLQVQVSQLTSLVQSLINRQRGN